MKTLTFCATLVAAWTLAVTAAEQPDIILIMSDDMGISDIGCYGSEIETPHLDGLAADGLRFTQFYNTARCCPTRASLLTGLYPHQAGIGHMMNDRGYDGYRGELNRNSVTIAEVLRPAGYRTYISGKWHVTQKVDPRDDSEKFNWPLQRGFDRFYGTIHGAGSFYDPKSLARNNELISPYADPEYQPETFYYTDAISDHAVRFIQEHDASHADDPIFMYVSYTAAHWPMHALEKDIARYEGKYDAGYQATREARYQKMLELGIVDAESTESLPIPDEWKEMGEFRAWDLRNMEVYAAMVDNMDQGIGRIVAALEKTGRLDNTILLYFQDNGGCAETYGRRGEGGPRADAPSLPPLADDYLQPDMRPLQTRDGYPMRTGKGVMAGPPDADVGYGRGWATVSNTPFREYKHWVHEGGISTPLIAHWPAEIDRHGELEDTPSHLIDLMATCVEAAGAEYPEEAHGGQKIHPMEGKSLLPVFAGEYLEREALYWEHEGNRAIRAGDWKLVAKGVNGPWELYDISADRTEINDLADERPAIAAKLEAMWDSWAESAFVLPLNPKHPDKVQAEHARNQKRFEFKERDSLPTEEAPWIPEHSIHLEASVTPLSVTSNGVIIAQGGSSQGWSLFVDEGELGFAIARDGRETFMTGIQLPAEPVSISARYAKNGKVAISVGDQKKSRKLAGAMTRQPIDGLQVGEDTGGLVGTYSESNQFQGSVQKIVLELTD